MLIMLRNRGSDPHNRHVVGVHVRRHGSSANDHLEEVDPSGATSTGNVTGKAKQASRPVRVAPTSKQKEMTTINTQDEKLTSEHQHLRVLLRRLPKQHEQLSILNQPGPSSSPRSGSSSLSNEATVLHGLTVPVTPVQPPVRPPVRQTPMVGKYITVSSQTHIIHTVCAPRQPPLTPDSAQVALLLLKRQMAEALEVPANKVNSRASQIIMGLFEGAGDIIADLNITVARLQGRLQEVKVPAKPYAAAVGRTQDPPPSSRQACKPVSVDAKPGKPSTKPVVKTRQICSPEEWQLVTSKKKVSRLEVKSPLCTSVGASQYRACNDDWPSCCSIS